MVRSDFKNPIMRLFTSFLLTCFLLVFCFYGCGSPSEDKDSPSDPEIHDGSGTTEPDIESTPSSTATCFGDFDGFELVNRAETSTLTSRWVADASRIRAMNIPYNLFMGMGYCRTERHADSAHNFRLYYGKDEDGNAVSIIHPLNEDGGLITHSDGNFMVITLDSDYAGPCPDICK
jgi:hypothetical protein